MAGSFGYEAEHYDISMQIGEMVLFPAVRSLPPDIIVAAPGTSCRHQIRDGTGRRALHPVEILYEALRLNLRNYRPEITTISWPSSQSRENFTRPFSSANGISRRR